MNWLSQLRAGYGAALLLLPDSLGGQLTGGRLTRATRRSIRILAARQLFEAAVCAVDPRPSVVRLEALVDAIHAGTMGVVAVATDNRSSRRAAVLNVVTAAAFVGADIVAMSQARARYQSAPSGYNRLLYLRDKIARQLCEVLPYPAGTR
jgi:hypothetical protein